MCSSNASPIVSYCCGDGLCNGLETDLNCPIDNCASKCGADATFFQPSIFLWAHSQRLSMYSRSSGQVTLPGVASGGTNAGQSHFGYAPPSLHMSSQAPASLFWNWIRFLRFSASQASSS